MLELKDFFFAIKDEIYCVIKPDKKLPKYSKGSDIDIFCYDSNVLAMKILAIGNKYIIEGFEIFISKNNDQIYIDFKHKKDNKIELRFDIYNSLPAYENVLIKPAFFENILENRIISNLTDDFSIFVPSILDDNILRYIEYQEWYGRRPDKIKHIDYILENNSTFEIKKFLQKLHHYTELPKVESVYPVRNKRVLPISLKKKISKFLPKKIKTFIKRYI